MLFLTLTEKLYWISSLRSFYHYSKKFGWLWMVIAFDEDCWKNCSLHIYMGSLASCDNKSSRAFPGHNPMAHPYPQAIEYKIVFFDVCVTLRYSGVSRRRKGVLPITSVMQLEGVHASNSSSDLQYLKKCLEASCNSCNKLVEWGQLLFYGLIL